MATWCGVELAVDGEFCGAGFSIDRPAERSVRYALPDGSASLQAGASVIVVTPSDTALRGDALLRVGFDTANEALDVHWAMAGGAFALKSAHREGLLWWSHQTGATARIRTSVAFQQHVDVNIVVTRDGVGVEESADNPPPQPSPELAYLRRAQLAEDTFDAYRNLWLALEAALQRVSPKTGDEREWLIAALARVDELYPGDFGKVWPEFIDRHYAAYRCALFHAARDDRRTPGVYADLLEVTAAIEEAAQLVPQLAQRVIGWNSGRGITTEAGWGAQRRQHRGCPHARRKRRRDARHARHDRAVQSQRGNGRVTRGSRYPARVVLSASLSGAVQDSRDEMHRRPVHVSTSGRGRQHGPHHSRQSTRAGSRRVQPSRGSQRVARDAPRAGSRQFRPIAADAAVSHAACATSCRLA